MNLQRIFAILGLSFLSITFAIFSFEETGTSAADAYFILTSKASSVKKGDTLEVVLALSNPSKQNIASFETWISYDPTKLKGTKIDFGSTNAFDLNLVKGEAFFPTEKVVKISRLSTGSTAGTSEFLLATMSFEVLTESSSDQLLLDFYKDTEGSLAKNSANVVIDDVATNIIDGEKLKPLIIPVGLVSAAPQNTNTSTSTVIPSSTVNTNRNSTSTISTTTSGESTSLGSAGSLTSNDFASLSPDASTVIGTLNESAPTSSTTQETKNIRGAENSTLTKNAPSDPVFTKAERSISISWKNDPAAVSTLIYYSTTKDQFTRSKHFLAPLESYTFKNLKAQTPYYFVLRYVYADGSEGPLSKEYEVSTGAKETLVLDSLKPAGGAGTLKAFEASSQAAASLAKVPRSPASGPEFILLILAFSSILIGYYLTHTKKHI